MNTAYPRFHLAIPVDDLIAATAFYGGVLQCRIGRGCERLIDFEFMGHQLTAHLIDAKRNEGSNPVDGNDITVPHFGMILRWQDWEVLMDHLREYHVDFALEPTIRFQGKPGEQGTAFVRDPAGNMLEFKAFREDAEIFAREDKEDAHANDR